MKSFFIWHRNYIQDLEQWLLNNGHSNFVPLPAWDPSSGMPTEFLNAIVPGIVGSEATFLGTTFDVEALNNVQANTLVMYEVDELTCSQFDEIDAFSGFIRAGVQPDPEIPDLTSHNLVHGSIGGAMSLVPTASAAAIFWVFHAHVDDLYECYLSECEGCSSPFIRLEVEQSSCNPCLSTDLSTNISGSIELEYFDSGGNAINPEFNSQTGCINNNWRLENISPDETITVRAVTEECRGDEVVADITFPKIFTEGSGRKISYTPCWPIDLHKLISPNPTGGGLININVTNQGEYSNLTVMRTDLQTSASEIIMSGISLPQNGNMNIQINTSAWTTGQHAIVFISDSGIESELITKF